MNWMELSEGVRLTRKLLWAVAVLGGAVVSVRCPAGHVSASVHQACAACPSGKFAPAAVVATVTSSAAYNVSRPSFWETACANIPAETGHITVKMGTAVDHFKPIRGATFCEMLLSNEKHQIMNTDPQDGSAPGWTTPEYQPLGLTPGALGGSAVDWPANNINGDSRKYLSFWGNTVGAGGTKAGCCNDAHTGAQTPNWNRMYTMVWHDEHAIFSYDGSSCLTCPSGKYTSSPNASFACSTCPSGKFQPDSTGISRSSCLQSACLGSTVYNADQAVEYEAAGSTFETKEDEDDSAGGGQWGAVLGPDLASGQYVYGIPHSREAAIKINVATGTSSYVTSSVMTGLLANSPNGCLWRGGVRAPNNAIYGCPRSASQVFKLNTSNDEITLFIDNVGSSLHILAGRSDDKWQAPVLANGFIYCMPMSANNVLKINPITDTVTVIGHLPSGISISTIKWTEGALAPNGFIYMLHPVKTTPC